MANNYPYENLSQPLVDLDPPRSPSSAKKRKNTLKVILLVGLFIVLIGAAVGIAVVLRLKSISSIPKLSLIYLEKEASLYELYKISPSSRYLAYVTDQRNIKVYNIESQSTWAEFKPCSPYMMFCYIYFMENEELLRVVSCNGFVCVYDLKTKSKRPVEYLGDIFTTYKVTKDNKYVVINYSDWIVIRSYEQEDPILWILKPDEIGTIKLSPDEKYIIGASYLRSHIYVWDMKTGVELYRLESTGVIETEFTPDSRYIVAKHEIQDNLRGYKFLILHIEKGDKIAETYELEVALEYRVCKNNKHFAVGTNDGVEIFEIETAKSVGKYLEDNFIRALSISRDGRFLFASGNDDYLGIVDLETEGSVSGFEINQQLEPLDLSEDDRYLLGYNRDNLYLWRVD